MTAESKCQECGTTIPTESVGGFCPQCLLHLGLQAAAAPSVAEVSISSVTEKSGDRIGRYRLLQEIGHGGCGVVYMAEQEQPVRRKVALKVIKLGMDTKQVVARFDAERQALALMDHPNIAKVLDAGATEAGRPYFVMELVGGVKITEYCDQHKLDTRQRLDLFTQVCRAIQHAHQKGIIHRDIKPSNVLVGEQDGVAVPKVIDFGIAKATQGRLTDQTLFTAFEQFLGTPAYMSPEQTQLGSLDVDTRSDIYSLGVLLYELLTGTTPFDTRELVAAGLDEMRRTIREVEPVKPSTRVMQERTAMHAAVGKSALRAPHSAIDRDLDWIVMKCLAKDRARRYETASGLAADIQRHLTNQPIVARPPSRLYEFQKTVRRHKFGFLATGIVIMALTLSATLSIWHAIRATQAKRQAVAERGRADIEAAKSREVARFLQDMLKGVGPSVARGRDRTMLREILDRTNERIGKELTNQPEVEADLRFIVGKLYDDLGEFDKAEVNLQVSLAIRRRISENGSPAVADSLVQLGYTLWRKNLGSESVTVCHEAVGMNRGLYGNYNSKLARALDQYANALWRTGESTSLVLAADAAREALKIERIVSGTNRSASLAYALGVMGQVLRQQGDLQGAKSNILESIGILSEVEDNGELPWRMGNLSEVLMAEREFGQAVAEARKAVAVAERNQDIDAHVGMLGILGKALYFKGDLKEAEQVLSSAKQVIDSTFAGKHAARVRVLETLKKVQDKKSKSSPAE